MHKYTACVQRICIYAASQNSVAAYVIVQLFDDVLGLARFLALLLDLVAGVHDGGMVALEDLCDVGEGVFELLADHVHRHLARIRDVLGAVLGDRPGYRSSSRPPP